MSKRASRELVWRGRVVNWTQWFGALLLTDVAALVVTGCGGDAVVAESVDRTSENTDDIQGDGGVAPPVVEGACATEDTLAKEGHDRWLGAGNDWGVLAGTQWEGEFAAIGDSSTPLDVRLELSTAQSGTLEVGDPVSNPVANQGYLVDAPEGALKEPLYYSGTYELRGGLFANGELTLLIPQASAFEPWCLLQTPYPMDTAEPDSCGFLAHPNGRLTSNGNRTSCEYTASGEAVDCDWYFQSNSQCVCTSTSCFSAATFPLSATWNKPEDHADRRVAARLSYDAANGTLSGSAVANGTDYHFELTQVAP